MFRSNLLFDVGKWFFIALWLGGNAILFLYTFWKYYTWDEFYYLRTITGIPIAFSRGSAAALNLNLALILLPVCRNIISLIRGSCPIGRTLIWRHLDKNITFHKLCGYTICFWTVIHFIGHTFNIERFVFAQRLPDQPTDLKHELSELPITPNGSWLNPIRTNDTSPMYELVGIIPGWSGCIAILCLVAMFSSSTEFIRRTFFEIFWYVHHLFVIFFVVVIVHGFGGVIRSQGNLDKHDCYDCQYKCSNWTRVLECPAPEFVPKPAETWKWVIGPLCLYAIERFIRFVRSIQKVELLEVICHPSNVLELRMKKWGFHPEAGQYVFVNCPDISRLQWHPFTLTSAPDDEYFSVHIRQVGDWTKALADRCHCSSPLPVDISMMPRIAVDGPFGTSSEDVFQYKVIVLVGAGIGVTPFASILKHIWYKHSHPDSSTLQKVYFHWVCSDTKCFEWFAEMLRSLEEKMEEEGTHNYIDISMYWTRGWNNEEREFIIETVYEPRDAITRLRSKTNFGRPNWDGIFADLGQQHIDERIGVFFCGPKEMSRQLNRMCNKHSSLDQLGTRFIFNKENF